MKKIIWWLVVGIVGVLFLFIILPHWVKKVKEKPKEVWVQIMKIDTLNGQKIYIPWKSDFTPMEIKIDFPAAIETQGKKVQFLYPCLEGWILWEGFGFSSAYEGVKNDICKGVVKIKRFEE